MYGGLGRCVMSLFKIMMIYSLFGWTSFGAFIKHTHTLRLLFIWPKFRVPNGILMDLWRMRIPTSMSVIFHLNVFNIICVCVCVYVL